MGTLVIINGQLVYVTFDQNGYVTKIVIPGIRDPNTGEPQTITFEPAVTISIIFTLIEILMGVINP